MKDISEIRQLPLPDRLELVAEIWDSICEETASLPISADTFAELDRRLEEHRRNPETSRPWDEVQNQVFGEE